MNSTDEIGLLFRAHRRDGLIACTELANLQNFVQSETNTEIK